MRLVSYEVTIAAPIHVGASHETMEDHEQGWAYFLGALRDTLSAAGAP